MIVRAARRCAAALAAVWLVAPPAAAHDFWIDVASYRQRPAVAFPIRFRIGEPGAAEPWETLWRKIVSLRSYGPAGVTDLQHAIRTTTATAEGGAMVTLAGEGTHVVALESYHADSTLPADEFNSYAEHEGLTPALAKRERDGSQATPGRELYSRRAKALIRVGAASGDMATRPIGQTLEIVPERDPYALGAADPLIVRILYRGAPLPGASVVLERLDAAAHGTPAITDGEGRVRFAFAKSGRWRVGVVWTQPIDHPRADFDTVFSSLTFGY